MSLRRGGGIGHSDADARTCRLAASAAGQAGAGAVALTHCWNAHRRFSPRDPGPAGWALASQGVTVGLISGWHPRRPGGARPHIRGGCRAGSRSRPTRSPWLAPIFRPLRSTCALGGRTVRVQDGAARLDDGTLAGSVATPTSMLQVLEDAGVGFEVAVEAMSAPGARLLGLGAWRMRPGDPGDM